MIDIIIGIPNMGSDTGPLFDLYSDLDNYQVPFETNVSKVNLLTGYTTTAPVGSTIIRVQSKGTCETYHDITILEPTTTTSTTTTTTMAPTTTTTTTVEPTTTTTSTTTTTTEPVIECQCYDLVSTNRGIATFQWELCSGGLTQSEVLGFTVSVCALTDSVSIIGGSGTYSLSSNSCCDPSIVITSVNSTLIPDFYNVFFTINFTPNILSYEISYDGINWSTPEVFNDISSPQLFSTTFSSFYIRLTGDSVVSNEYFYQQTTTTTTLPPGIFVDILISNGSSNPNLCGTALLNNKFIYTTQFNQGQYPLPGDIVCNTANLNDRFIGNNLYYRMVYTIADSTQSSIVAKISGTIEFPGSAGTIYDQSEICPPIIPI